MSIATMIERIVGKQRARQAARSADFRDIVAQIADGKEPDADFVTQVLHDAEKTLDDLQKAVELLQRRRDLRQKLDSVPRLQAELQELDRKIAAADHDLDAAEELHASIVHPLIADVRLLKEQIFAGDQARGELWRSCDNPDLLATLAEVEAKRNAVNLEATEKRRAIHNYRVWATIDRQNAKGALQEEAKQRIQRAESRERLAEQIETEMATIEKNIAALEIEVAAIRKRMLEP